MTAAFGAPVPLPGQPGFRAKPSDSMARENAEMEERLSRLKTDLAAEAEQRQASGPKVGGARWRSARTDRGSVRAYAKDVKVRHKEQLQRRPSHGIFASSGAAAAGVQAQPQAGAGARAAAALRDEQRRRHHHHQDRGEREDGSADPRASASDQHAFTHRGFKGKEVSRWCVGDTLEWLESLGLGKHKAVFQQNEISGPILLEVGLDDLDYMKLFVLAHRKQILKGIEELRRGSGRPSADMPPPPVPAPPVSREYPDNTDTTDSGVGTREESVAAMSTVGEDHRRSGPRPPPERIKKKHWSHIEPMASSGNQTGVNGGRDGLLSTNHSNDRFDRAGVRFTGNSSGAAAERHGGPHSGEPVPSFRQTPEAAGQTPFAENAGTETGTAVGVSGVRRRAGGTTLLAGSGTAGCWTNPFPALSTDGNEALAQGDSQLVELDAEVGSPPRFAKAAAIGTGQVGHQEEESIAALDEEAEHEAFRAAVAEWNRGSKLSANQSDGGGGDAATTSAIDRSDRASCLTTTEVAVAAVAVKRTTEMVADELRSQMDAEHRQQAQELEKKKKGLLESLETARGVVRLECGAGEGKNADSGGGEPGTGGGIGLSCKFGGESGTGGGGEVCDELHASRDGKEADDDWEEIGDSSVSSASSCRSTAFSSSGGETVQVEEGALGQSGRDVEIVFMESVLGVDSLADGDGSYLVDEGESDDGDGHDL